MSKQFKILNQFIKGLRGDFVEEAENPQSYVKGENGRLYSHNGTIAFSSVKGTKLVYTNPFIVSYHGYCAFNDELLIFVKALPAIATQNGGSITYQSINKLIARSFEADIPFGSNSVAVDFTGRVNNFQYTIPIFTPAQDPFGFNTNLSCVTDDTDTVIDLSQYFTENSDLDNIQVCPINTESNLFENNIDYLDCIISLKKDSSGLIYDQLLWAGYQNWPLDAKIMTQGVDENSNLRRVYYTDYFNVFRMANTKDANLKYKDFMEFDVFQNAALLQPEVELIDNGGQIKASTVFYTYRLFTGNGQQTTFAPFSLGTKILRDDVDSGYSGGDISEITDKKVLIKINLPSFAKFTEIEAFAVEYEAFGSPSSIRSLGIFPAAPVVHFIHYGNEAEFSTDVTLSDLVEKASEWRYCSDILSSRNKLLASALRNEPIPATLLGITEDFALHGWDITGATHNCVINPKPYKYRYFDPTATDPLYYINRKVYQSIQVFGSYTVFIKNLETGENFSQLFLNNNLTYVNVIDQVWIWLQTIMNTSGFIAAFPNLTLSSVDDKILFEPIVDAIETDMNNYIFTYSTTQVVEDIKKEIEFTNVVINTSNLIYGGVSLGFNSGNGIRISFRTEEHELMSQSTSSDMDNFLNLNEADDRKGFMKKEIYRIGMRCCDKKGNELFVIPMGDFMVPAIGEQKRYLNDNGDIVIESSGKYRNSFIRGDKLYSEKIILNVDVRLSCELQKVIDTYELVYVERIETNRTILAQGLSAPMERCRTYFRTEYIFLTPHINNKWNIPYYGGPSYDWQGLLTYDDVGADYDEEQESKTKRIITNRKLVYFDAPDIIHSIIGSDLIKAGNIVRVARLNTDHMPRVGIRSAGLPNPSPDPIFVPLPIPGHYIHPVGYQHPDWFPGVLYPSFSRKVLMDDIDYNDNYKPRFINISVFASERPGLPNPIPIKRSELLLDGQEMAGYKFDTNFDISNNALVLARQSWFYSSYARRDQKCQYENGDKSELFNSNNFSQGATTVVLSAEEDIFSDTFIAMAPITISGEVRLGNGNKTYDTHGLINIEMNNLDSVYGGRTESAYSKNIYIPLSKTIPVLETSNGIQNFRVYGDTYCSLFIRNKNWIVPGFERGDKTMNNSGGCENAHQENDHTRMGAWFYAAVVESAVETRWTYKDTAWKQQAPFDLTRKGEDINEAYFQNASPKTYIPKPYRFSDIPDMTNVVAVSDVKINGAFIDNWTRFRVNNFYEIDKDKGAILNLGKYLDRIFAIQQRQESELILDSQSAIATSNGDINIKQGDGNSISNHQVVSDFGTSIRGAVVDIISSSEKIKGFSFFDEGKIEFVRISNPLLVENNLHLKLFELLKNDPVIDSTGYYDDEYKETNIRLRTKSGLGFVLSFNEIFGVFNGYIEYDNDLYMVWNQDVYAPKTILMPKEDHPEQTRKDSSALHQLNIGDYLNFFGEQKTMKLGILVNQEAEKAKIYPHWAGMINIDYPIKTLELKTSLGQLRTVLGSHHRYNIREGIHSVPLKNRTDWEDLRGNWMYLEVEIESIDNKKVDVYSFLNFVRESYL